MPLPAARRDDRRNSLTIRARLMKACSAKCIPREYREGELNKGESVCLDRCAAKFFDTYTKTNELMQQASEKMMQGAK